MQAPIVPPKQTRRRPAIMSDQDRAADVRAAVWRWKERDGDATVARQTDTRKPGVIQFCIAVAIGLLMLFWLKHLVIAVVIFSIASTMLALALFMPPAFRAVERGFLWLAHWVGRGMTWLVLVPFYFLTFTVGRIFILVTKRDPLNRECPSGETTYWQKRRKVDNPKHYQRWH